MWPVALPSFQLPGGPRLATSARASNFGGSWSGRASSLKMSRSPCIGVIGAVEPSVVTLATVSSSNHVGRRDLTPSALCELATLIVSRRRLWYIGGTTLG